LKMPGWPTRARASLSASTQNPAVSVFDSRQDTALKRGFTAVLKEEACFDFVDWHHCIRAEGTTWPKPRALIEPDGFLLMDSGHRRTGCTSFVLYPSQQSLG